MAPKRGKGKEEGQAPSSKRAAGPGPRGASGSHTRQSSLVHRNHDRNNSSDPFTSHDWDCGAYPASCYARIGKELKMYLQDPPPEIFMVPRTENVAILDCMIVGPEETPYAGGFFHFVIQCPPEYPFNPPRVRFMTTAGGAIRFNPNFYRSGIICLSIIGTWGKADWSPTLGLTSTMLSIQSLMGENPYFNEPGVDHTGAKELSDMYNIFVKYETLRVAVAGVVAAMLANEEAIPETIRQAILKRFYSNRKTYLERVRTLLPYEGKYFQDPLGSHNEAFRVNELVNRMEVLLSDLKVNQFPFLVGEKPKVDVGLDVQNERGSGCGTDEDKGDLTTSVGSSNAE